MRITKYFASRPLVRDFGEYAAHVKNGIDRDSHFVHNIVNRIFVLS